MSEESPSYGELYGYTITIDLNTVSLEALADQLDQFDALIPGAAVALARRQPLDAAET